MKDEFAGERLPDLPNAGYSTRREKELSDNIMDFLRQIERDRFRLLTVVLKGRGQWRHIASQILRGADTDLLDSMFDYLVLMSATDDDQAELLANLQNPPKCREVLHRMQPELERQYEYLKTVRKWS